MINSHRKFTSNNIEEFYEKLDEKILDTRHRQLKIQSSFPEYIDMSAASSMNLYKQNTINTSHIWEICEKLMTKYPSLHSTEYHFEQSVCDMLKKYIWMDFGIDTITKYWGGVYGSYHTLLHALQRKHVLLPKLLHQTHKYCISMTWVHTIEINSTQEYILDIWHLESELQKIEPWTGLVYINHNRWPNITKKYINDISDLLSTYNALCIYDADVIYSSHDGITKPYFPLLNKKFLEYSIVLINLTKEHGKPWLRIGIWVSGSDIASRVRKYQKSSLSMISPITENLAVEVIKHTDLYVTESILKKRMNCMVRWWEDLWWIDIRKPAIGINLFIDIPKSFTQQHEVPWDELFYYYLLSKTGILIRPWSIYGKDIVNQIRPVICQPVEVMRTIFITLKENQISYDMPLPIWVVPQYKAIIWAQ